MNHLALGIMAIIVIIYVLISSYIQNKKRTMNRIRSQFGSIPYLDVRISEMLRGKFENCHFSEILGEEDILFDYKVKNGVSKSRNAIKLLKHIGFPEKIVRDAENLVLHTEC